MSSNSLQLGLREAINSRIEALIPNASKVVNRLEVPIFRRLASIAELDQFAIFMEAGFFSVYYVKRAGAFIVSDGWNIYATDSNFEALVIKSIAEFNYMKKGIRNGLHAA